MSKLTIEITTEQAEALVRQLDLAMRIHLCQFHEIELIARIGDIKHRSGRELTFEENDKLRHRLAQVSEVFGFSANSSFGIGSPHVDRDAHRGYELLKVLQKELAEWHEPEPKDMTTVYGGLICRYTDDPAPVVKIEGN